jgi:hypothetical protein
MIWPAALAVSFLAAAGALAALVGILGVPLPGRPEPWRPHLIRRATWPAGAGAGAVHSLGLAGVAGSVSDFGDGADSVPAPACRTDFPPQTVAGLSHHRASYLPPAFTCVREDGRTCRGGTGRRRRLRLRAAGQARSPRSSRSTTAVNSSSTPGRSHSLA